MAVRGEVHATGGAPKKHPRERSLGGRSWGELTFGGRQQLQSGGGLE